MGNDGADELADGQHAALDMHVAVAETGDEIAPARVDHPGLGADGPGSIRPAGGEAAGLDRDVAAGDHLAAVDIHPGAVADDEIGLCAAGGDGDEFARDGAPGLEPGGGGRWRREDLCHEVLQRRGILRIEGGGLVAVDVEDGDHGAGRVEDRHDDFRAGRGGAGDMTWKGLDIVDELCPALAGRGAADPAVEGDGQAAVAALVGADAQQAGLGHPVEADPVEPLVRLVEFGGDRGHQGDPVALSGTEGENAGRDFGMGFRHGHLRAALLG